MYSQMCKLTGLMSVIFSEGLLVLRIVSGHCHRADSSKMVVDRPKLLLVASGHAGHAAGGSIRCTMVPQ